MRKMTGAGGGRTAGTFRYFAYGSNMWLPRMHERCPSARALGTATLRGWRAVYDKPSQDGSAKVNIRRDAAGTVTGVRYEIDSSERPRLDAAEPGYEALDTSVGVTYAYQGPPSSAAPYDWYVALVEAGARAAGLMPPVAPSERA
jgi:Gamma-glutamyl cyclotransferase, AIG2-like